MTHRPNAGKKLVEPGGFSPATENKPLTSIDPDFPIKNGTILAPKCNQECNHDSADANASRIGEQFPLDSDEPCASS